MSLYNRYIIANWKMNPASIDKASVLVKKTRDFLTAESSNSNSNNSNNSNKKTIILAPFVYLPLVATELSSPQNQIEWGAQNCSISSEGACTGEISVKMLKSLGCRYVLAGHSECRTKLGETDYMINQKVHQILREGLTCILCVGENLEQFKQGQNTEVCAQQLQAGLQNCPVSDMDKIIIAYEPVWAIGTGLTATPDIAENVHAFIREWISSAYSPEVAEKITIIYGGSVNCHNSKMLLSQPNINGALVGGASLDPSQIVNI